MQPTLTVACFLRKSGWHAVLLRSALTALLLAPLAALAQDSVTKPGSGRPAFVEESVLWQNKEENAWPYHVYGLVQATKGTLLAFAEGRQGQPTVLSGPPTASRANWNAGRT